MQNETKLSKDKINSLLNMLKNGKTDSASLKNMLTGALDEAQKNKLQSIMSDPEKIRELLSSPQAKSLMEKLGKSPQGENNDDSP